MIPHEARAAGARAAGARDSGEGDAGERDPSGAQAAEIRDMPLRWPVVSSVENARGPIVTLRSDDVRMPDGEVSARQVVEHPGAVAVAALDEAARILMIRQYRHPVGRLLWELPAGLRDVAGEPLLATAQRELLEETGYRARDWAVLVDFFASPGIITERIRMFLARGLTLVPRSERNFIPQHEEAHLLLAWVPLEQAVARFLRGDLHNGVAGVGILSAYAASRSGFAALRRPDAPEH